MPKSTIPPLPLQGIFALNKPSGPTTMSLLTRLKPLFSSSRLFVEPKKLEAAASSKQQSMRRSYPGPTMPGDLTGKDRNKGREKGSRTNWKRVSKQYVKMGSGGTLDPLADGVLIVGVGSGTKDLAQFLHCTKTYRTIGLLGCETDSYDSEGAITRLAPWKHVNRSLIISHLDCFRGEILQTPPIFSALKIEGKALYEYARQNIPLPRPIEARKVMISKIDLTNYTEAPQHSFKFPTKRLSPAEVAEWNKVLKLVVSDSVGKATLEVEKAEERVVGHTGPEKVDVDGGVVGDGPGGLTTNARIVDDGTRDAYLVSPESDSTEQGAESPPTFELEMAVSSGTYVRSVVHDLGLAVGSAAHVVSLTRVQQGRFVLDAIPNSPSPHPTASGDMGGFPCVDWKILEKAVAKWEAAEEIEVDDDGWAEWELEVVNKWPNQSLVTN